MIDFARIAGGALQTDPYRWARIDGLFAPHDAAALAATFPRDRFKLVSGYGGEKDYEYEARELIPMAGDAIAGEDHLSASWQRLAHDFRTADYRAALSALTGCDLSAAALEVNVFHYGPGASLGAHPDLPDKILTHILYFNDAWDERDGGCLAVLRSKDPDSAVATIAPVVGNSAVIVRSDGSWHAVSRVVSGCRASRRSLTATFYHPGSISTMWPPGEAAPLHDVPW